MDRTVTPLRRGRSPQSTLLSKEPAFTPIHENPIQILWRVLQVVHKKFVTQFALLSFTCSFSPPAWYCPHATFELGKELRSSQSSESELAGQQALLFRWY